MRRWIGGIVAALAALGTLVLPSAALAAQHPPRFVLTEQEAVIADPPVVVSEGKITQAEWSRDGRYLFAIRVHPREFSLTPGIRDEYSLSLVLWDRKTQRSRTVWQTAGQPELPKFQLQWLGGTAIVLGTIDSWTTPIPPPGQPVDPTAEPVRHRWLARLDARTGAFRLLSEVAHETEFHASPTRPVAFLYRYVGRTEQILQFVSSEGRIAPPVSLPPGRIASTAEWTEAGDVAFVGRRQPPPNQASKVIQWFTVDPATGSFSPTATQPRAAPPRPDRDDTIAVTQTPLTPLPNVKPAVRVRPLWLAVVDAKPDNPQPRTLLAKDAEWGRLSPDGGAVLYVVEGTTWVCPLRRVAKEAFLPAWRVARREQLRFNARQIGTGAMMYAQDYDETLPGAEQDIRSLFLPYVKDSDLFEGFVYTFLGGKLSDVEVPANTLLGHTPVDGGRILLYVDGHVKFEPNQ